MKNSGRWRRWRRNRTLTLRHRTQWRHACMERLDSWCRVRWHERCNVGLLHRRHGRSKLLHGWLPELQKRAVWTKSRRRSNSWRRLEAMRCLESRLCLESRWWTKSRGRTKSRWRHEGTHVVHNLLLHLHLGRQMHHAWRHIRHLHSCDSSAKVVEHLEVWMIETGWWEYGGAQIEGRDGVHDRGLLRWNEKIVDRMTNK